MGNIIEQKRRYYSGLAADMASIPAGGKAVGDQYFQTDTKLLYQYDGASWNLAGPGFGRYVVLRKAAVDWDQTDLTLDSAVHENALDLATKGVVSGAIAVHLKLAVNDNAADKEFDMYPNQVDVGNTATIEVLVANRWHRKDFIMPCDANLLVDYYGTTGLDNVNITVVGYVI